MGANAARAIRAGHYFEARLAEMAGDKADARSACIARPRKQAEFHGFLAADRLDQAYALCPWMPERLRRSEGRDRARSRRSCARWRCTSIDRAGWAQREWDSALSRFDDTQRRLAVEVAQDNGWFDRARVRAGQRRRQSRPDELRLYELRFPLHHDATIRREAAKQRPRSGLGRGRDPRRKRLQSASARSGANAMGLMQVAARHRRRPRPSASACPGAAPTACTTRTPTSCWAPPTCGRWRTSTAQPYLAIAAYNAGPAPTARWQSQRPAMDPDFWIETISYKETREYVARVLAFSVIYDWRFNGNACR